MQLRIRQPRSQLRSIGLYLAKGNELARYTNLYDLNQCPNTCSYTDECFGITKGLEYQRIAKKLQDRSAIGGKGTAEFVM
ncbi:hypothetical protein AC249_AIPGENE8544 [Exaiptasia diaphana]|nr:hypothetical protein AC249_AIPGENE8544 [Exaiptasia diaphana]